MSVPLFTGCAAAMVTPFKKDHSVDSSALSRLIDLQLSAGMDALVLLGTTGEASTLSLQEREQIITLGVQQIGARIAYNEIDLVLFFRDPLNAESYEPDVFSLLRLCDMHNIPIATNSATAEVLIRGLERGDLDWRDIVNPKN